MLRACWHAEGKYKEEDITKFVLANRLPLLITFSNEATTLIFSGPVKKLVSVSPYSSSHPCSTLQSCHYATL